MWPSVTLSSTQHRTTWRTAVLFKVSAPQLTRQPHKKQNAKTSTPPPGSLRRTVRAMQCCPHRRTTNRPQKLFSKYSISRARHSNDENLLTRLLYDQSAKMPQEIADIKKVRAEFSDFWSCQGPIADVSRIVHRDLQAEGCFLYVQPKEPTII
jgi:hypothetical protein